MLIALLRVKWKKELVRACSADFRGIFVLLTAFSLSFLLTGLSPSCYDKFLAMVLNTDADKSSCNCKPLDFWIIVLGTGITLQCMVCR